MQALTICQPFAELIVADGESLPAGQTPKRVENRNWPTSHRGPVLIHAGRQTRWLTHQGWDVGKYPVPLGAIVGVADLVGCVPIDRISEPEVVERFPWLPTHPHALGRFCWIFEDVRRFMTPLPASGLLGLWHMDDVLVKPFLASAVAVCADLDRSAARFAG